MNLRTVSEMVLDESGRSDISPATLNLFINSACRDISTRCFANTYTATDLLQFNISSSLKFIFNDRYPDVFAILAIFTSQKKQLKRISPEQMPFIPDIGEPDSYTIWPKVGSIDLSFNKLPTNSMMLFAYVQQHPVLLQYEDDTNALVTNHTNAVVIGTLKQIEIFNRNMAGAKGYQEQLDAHISSIILQMGRQIIEV